MTITKEALSASALSDFCLARIAAGDNYAAYDQAMRAWAASPDAERLGQPDPAQRWHLIHTLSRALWRGTPHPSHRFGPAPLPVLERNAPCHCGSGRKYKQCCLPMEGSMPMPRFNSLAELLLLLPPARWAELPGSRIDPDMVFATAAGWLEHGKLEEARTLLEPWFAKDRDFVAKRESLFDLLLDVYSAPGLLGAKQQLLQRAITHGERPIRSAALHRACTMASDNNDFKTAWELFRQAMRNEPDSVQLSHLEVLVLIREGREIEARERARFWQRKLAYLAGDPGAQKLLAFLGDVVERGTEAVIAISDPPEAALAMLREFGKLLQQAPPVKNLYRLSGPDARGGSCLKLKSLPSLKAGLEAWRDCFENPDDLSLEDEPAVLLAETADSWQQELLECPQLWNTFEVLDALSRWVEVLGEPVELDEDDEAIEQQADALVAQLAQRAVELLHLVLPVDPVDPPVTLPWRLKSNQRVLRMLERAIGADPEPSSALRLRLLRWVLALDPQDEMRLRLHLSRALLERADFAEVLPLVERYPENRTELGFNAVLALFADGQLPAAQSLLQELHSEEPQFVEYLLKSDDEDLDNGMLFDADAELASMYRDDMLDLWTKLGALDWLRSAAATLTAD